jgi:transcriptional regulator with XRE-family HTH domain
MLQCQRLKAMGLADAEVAAKLGVSQMTVTRWNRAAAQPPARQPVKPVVVVVNDERAIGFEEVVWLRELTARLLFENAELRRRIDLPQTAS